MEQWLADNELKTPREVGEFLGLGQTTVYELMASGKLRSVKIGKARRVPNSALKEFLEKATVTA